MQKIDKTGDHYLSEIQQAHIIFYLTQMWNITFEITDIKNMRLC